MSDQDDPYITMDDVAPLFCANGIAAWCKEHGLSARDLIRGPGIPMSKVIALNDAYGNAVVERFKQRQGEQE